MTYYGQRLGSKQTRTFGGTRQVPGNLWAVILAGGDGTRLRSLTRAIAGDDRPKQFCPILRNETLLDQTRRRVAISVPPANTMTVVTKTHERFYIPALASVSSSNLLVQPDNIGTTPAILLSLLRLAKVDSTRIVAIFPSDHYFADDATFMSHVESAYRAVNVSPTSIVLLGIEADRAEVEYGWIEPEPSILDCMPRAIRRVRRFWEKPSFDVAESLLSRGFLWNSFVMVGRVDVFLRMIENALPDYYASIAVIQRSLNTESEERVLRNLYEWIEPSNFSQDVLAVRSCDLAVMTVNGVGWSDWGDPSRVLSTLARIGVESEWAMRAS